MGEVTLNNKKKSGELISLDFLKFIATVLIVLRHSHFISTFSGTRYLAPFYMGKAVPLFMIISAYTLCVYIDKNKVQNAMEYFRADILGRRISRILAPYFTCILFVLIIALATGYFGDISFGDKLSKFFEHIFRKGLYGPGGYYPFVYLQFLFIFPVIYFGMKKFPAVTIVGCTVFCLFFAYIMLDFGEDFFRMMGFKYVLYIPLGIGLYMYMDQIKKSLLPWAAFFFGVWFIMVWGYFGYEPQLFKYWTMHSAPPIMLYVFAVVYFCLRAEDSFRKLGVIKKFFAAIGRASYHIFFVQLIVLGIVQYAGFDYGVLVDRIGGFLTLMLVFVVCFGMGYIWCAVESKIFRIIRNRRKAGHESESREASQ